MGTRNGKKANPRRGKGKVGKPHGTTPQRRGNKTVNGTSQSLINETFPTLINETSPALINETSPALINETSPALINGTSPALINGTSPALDWDARYGDLAQYKRLCAIAHKATNRICCCCLKHKSEEIHHAAYGRDKVGITVFPICKRCHDIKAHSEKNWHKDKKDPLWKNCNSKYFLERLQLGFKLLQITKT